ncbi:MAG: amidoligase family protein [Desulfosporosinus sp.]|nr:amidoligase family protein [Desulfosporosinus sp.]
MKTQTFGIEIELTGLTREEAANTVADYFGTQAKYAGGAYDAYWVKDNSDRVWKLMSDSSIRQECRTGPATPAHRVELVSPICQYEDIETVQEITRLLRKAGAKANSSCGIHIHIGMGQHTPKTLRNLANLVASKEDLIYEALAIRSSRQGYCKRADENFIAALNAKKPDTLTGLADLWYAPYTSENRTNHYNSSRYHLLNYHSIFRIGTIEFRAFNGTTHAGKIKAYIQFALAMSHQALTQKSASSRKTETTNQKYTFRTWLLRLGMIGEEFKTARMHLLANLKGDIAWRETSAA